MDDLTASDSESEHITREVLSRRRTSGHRQQPPGSALKREPGTRDKHAVGVADEDESSSRRSTSPLTSVSSVATVVKNSETTVLREGKSLQQARWKRIVETVLVLAPLVLAAYKTPLVYHPSYQTQLARWFCISMVALATQYKHASFPQTLYLWLFPPILSLVSDNADLLPLNLVLSMTGLPVPYDFVHILTIGILQQEPGLWWVLDMHLDICQIITWACSTSLTWTEVSLFASLVANTVAWFYGTTGVNYSQLVVLTAMISMIAAVPWLERLTSVSRVMGVHKRPHNVDDLRRRYSIAAAASFGTTAVIFMYLLLGVQGIWDLVYYTFFPDYHFTLLTYWGLILCGAIPHVMRHSHRWQLDLRRKVWHGVVVVMFLPTICVDASFVSLCMTVALILFLVLELVRATTMPPYGMLIHQTLMPYTDPRDMCGPVIVSHVFLLLGISLPVVLCKGSPAGVICLGLGDAAASIVGRRYGRKRSGILGITAPKTLEGTASFVVMVVMGLWVAARVCCYVRLASLSVLDMVIVAVATALLEATSGMNDNVIVPLYMLIVLELLI